MTKVRLIYQHYEKRGILRPKTKSLSSSIELANQT